MSSIQELIENEVSDPLMYMLWAHQNDVNKPFVSGTVSMLPLELAIARKNEVAIHTLVDAGASWNTSGGINMFVDVVFAGMDELVKICVLDDKSLLKAVGTTRTCLSAAVDLSDSSLFYFLLDLGADPMQKAQNGNNCMDVLLEMTLPWNFKRSKVLRLKDMGYMPSRKPRHICTFLVEKEEDLARWAIEEVGIPVGEGDLSPLPYTDNIEMVKFLFKHGAGKGANAKNKTPLGVSVDRNDEELVKFYLEKGHDPNELHVGGTPPLTRATLAGQTKMVEILLKGGANAGIPHYRKRTGLMIALCDNNTCLAKLLVEHSDDLDAQDKKGQTALHVACKTGNTEIVEMLLQKGASQVICDNQGRTPLERCVDEYKDQVTAVFDKHNVVV